LAEQYLAAAEHFGQIGEMLVGDWGKLRTAAHNAVYQWDWTEESSDRAATGLEFAARRFAFAAIFPTEYGGLLRATKAGGTLPIPANASRYGCWQYGRTAKNPRTWYPFGAAAALGGLTPVVEAGVAEGAPTREAWVFAQPIAANGGNPDEGNTIYRNDFKPVVPSEALLKQMFVEDVPKTQLPPFQPLEFAVSIAPRLKVLDVYHGTTENINGEKEYNQCEGQFAPWPWGGP
jgi:hypothetical protein